MTGQRVENANNRWWDRSPLDLRLMLVVATLAPVVTIFSTGTPWVRYSAVVAAILLGAALIWSLVVVGRSGRDER